MDGTIKSVPKTYYWFIWLLFAPVGGIVFTAIVVLPAVDFFLHSDLTGHSLIGTWLVVTLAGSAWILFIDYRKLYYVLRSNTLYVGRGSSIRVIPFDDIDSIVIGPPIPRYLGYMLIFIRLTEGRDFTLRVPPWMTNDKRLVSVLLRENHNRVVGTASYTKSEREKLSFGLFHFLHCKSIALRDSIRSRLRRKTPEQIGTLVTAELARIKDTKTKARLSPLLVTPYPTERGWDYGKPGEAFVCWMVLEHRESNTGVAYCNEGFGPKCPWGLLFLEGPNMSMGSDFRWYPTFESAFLESFASSD